MNNYGVTKYDPLTGCWPTEAVGEDGKVKQEWIDRNFYVDGKPWRIYLDGKSWEPANTETERIANRVCDRYGVVDRVDFYRKVGSDYVLMELEEQDQAKYLAEWRKHHPEDQQLSIREFLWQYGTLIGAIVLYALIVFSAFEAAKIF